MQATYVGLAGAPRTRPNDTAVRVAVGLGVYVVVVAGIITVLITHPDARGWPFRLLVALGIGFDGYCLADIARASQVRYLPKWAWALICWPRRPEAASPTCAGRVGRGRSAPPGPAPQP
jgi:hypothetical protein